ncbi:trypsin-like peptidase domain-containing protein [Streptomyces sp. NPDC088354]|uniref:trypsin-like peptidase domain-containing protein n=1 Tax=Streptomyces sp. NPDC088354 TaxID=3365856 RepID=UPI00381720E6
MVRVKGPDGEIAGAGFLVAPDLVLTCAHVVNDALARPRDEEVAAGAGVLVDLPFAEGGGPAEVERWVPVREDQTGDIAVLRLRAQTPAAHPLYMATPSACGATTSACPASRTAPRAASGTTDGCAASPPRAGCSCPRRIRTACPSRRASAAARSGTSNCAPWPGWSSWSSPAGSRRAI